MLTPSHELSDAFTGPHRPAKPGSMELGVERPLERLLPDNKDAKTPQQPVRGDPKNSGADNA